MFKVVTEVRSVYRKSNPESLDAIKNELHALNKFKSLQPTSICNIYQELVDAILRNYQYIKNETDVLSYGAMNMKDAKEILCILDRHCEPVEPESHATISQ